MNKQVWFTDDVTAGRSLALLRTWWDCISKIGPDYGYYPNAARTWLIVSDNNVEEAMTIFQGAETFF